MLRTDNITLKKRVKEVEKDLGAEKLEALVVYANGSALGNASKMHGYLRYLVNFDGHNTAAMLVLRPGHEPALISSNNPFNMRVLLRELPWFKDVRTTKPPLMGQAVVDILGDASKGKRRIGYVGFNETPVPVWKSLEKGLPEVEWVDFAPTLDKKRVQKDDLQLTFHRRAAEICDAIFQTLQRDVRKGLKAYQLLAAMEHAALFEGAEYCLPWLTTALRADYSRRYKEESARVPQEGDQVLAGIALTYDGHWGHAVRTTALGKPSDAHRKIYDIAREMYDAFLARLKPGEDLREAVAASEKVIQKYYRDDEVDWARIGHGLGFSYEDPIVSGAFLHPWEARNKPAGANAIEIKPGMLMELHPGFFIPGVGGAIIGDMIAVTGTGYEVLTEFPLDLAAW